MKKKSIVSLIMCIIVSFFLIGCSFKDDYIIQTKENTDEKPSGDKVDEAFNSQKLKDLMDKLKSTPKEVSDKLDEVDSDTTRMMNEINDKADKLTDDINNADIEGKSEDIKAEFDDISDELDEIKDKVNDDKDRVDTAEDPIDKTKVTDTLDEFTSHMNNLEHVLNRSKK